MEIDWKLFESRFWTPEKGVNYKVVLANWRMEMKSFDEDKTTKPCLVFDVLKIDDEEYAPGTKEFSTTAVSFADKIRPIIHDAETRGKKAVLVSMEYTRDKRYYVIDLEKAYGMNKNLRSVD